MEFRKRMFNWFGKVILQFNMLNKNRVCIAFSQQTLPNQFIHGLFAATPLNNILIKYNQWINFPLSSARW